MKIHLLGLLAAAALLAGCASSSNSGSSSGSMGGTSDTDQNVLTGGPISGTTIGDLPPPVRNTLAKRSPHGEIADIDKLNRDGNIVYKITFTNPNKYPRLFITETGGIWWETAVDVN